MEDYAIKGQRNIYNTIAVVKLASLLFCAIPFSEKIFEELDPTRYMVSDYFMVKPPFILALMIVLVYSVWLLFTVKVYSVKYMKTAKVIESLIFISIYTVSIYATGVQSNLKFLYLFTIIMSTIEVNENFGTLISFLSSLIILVMDLAYGNSQRVNSYFQDDLILVGVFILTAWVIGHYVKIENEKMDQKNSQLKIMDNEIRQYSKQRQYMEELLLKVDSCYNLLIENSNDAIFVQSNGKVILGNESSVKLFGVGSVNELINKDILAFVPIKNQQYVHEQLNNVYEGKNSMISFEHKINNKNNDFTTVRNTSAFFVYEGRPTVLSILHDITSEKQVEKLKEDVRRGNDLLEETREFNKLITEFFSNISHELKTPLNVIFSAIQLLNLYKESSVDNLLDKQDKYMKIMKQNCFRLMRLINNLLDLTKLDSGFLKLNLGNYNIISVIEDIVLSVAAYGESRGIDIIFDTDLEERIMTFDPDKIERIILNLMSNALKFTQKGGKIFVNLMNSDKDIAISVSDTGIGIPEDKLAVIFERFMQVDKTLRRENEGTGIGLSLVKAFVEMHQGTVDIRSELNFGSEFIIKLPVQVLKLETAGKCSTYEYNIERMDVEFSDIYSGEK